MTTFGFLFLGLEIKIGFWSFSSVCFLGVGGLDKIYEFVVSSMPERKEFGKL